MLMLAQGTLCDDVTLRVPAGQGGCVRIDVRRAVLLLCCLLLGQVIDEVTGGLEQWASKNRWEDLGIVQQVQEHPELQWA